MNMKFDEAVERINNADWVQIKNRDYTDEEKEYIRNLIFDYLVRLAKVC